MADAPFGALGLPADREYGQSQNIAVGDYQMPAFGARSQVDPLTAPDGLHIADRRPSESTEDRDGRMHPFYQAVAPLMAQFSQKPPETWNPAEIQKFQQTPQFISAARLAFPVRR